MQDTLLEGILCVGSSLFIETETSFKNFDSRAKNLGSRFTISDIQSESVSHDSLLSSKLKVH